MRWGALFIMMTRRQAIQTMEAAVGLAAQTQSVDAQLKKAENRRRPNVIVIVADDNGSTDLGCYGASDLHTPHLDSLAAQGVRLTQFYSAAPVCSASRAGVLTGRAPMRTTVTGNAASQRDQPGALPPDEVTLAQMFREAGYATACIGKWHLGYTHDTMPNAHGFDHAFGHIGGCIDSWSHFFYWSGPNVHDLYRNGKEIYAGGRFFADLMVEEAIQFLHAHHDRPFFLYFPPNMPHYPYQPEPKWLDHFAHLPFPRRLYAAWMAMMDERIGALLKRLDEHNLRENTIVIYQSDHGHSTEERAFFGGGSAGPYRGAKFSLYEGGIRVPALISWPGHLPENAVRSQMAWGCDWLPTLAALCDLPLPQRTLDGKSLVPLLQSDDAASPHEALVWAWNDPKAPQWAVHEDHWKLIGRPWDTSVNANTKPEEGVRLYHLENDIGERKNLAAQHPDIAAGLQHRYDAWISGLSK